jgi:mRNA-degrading endonuclease RelE of RelBE toxin-antitoxin system
MRLIFKERFNKEAKFITSTKVRREVIELIGIAEHSSSIHQIPDIKALRHYPGAYRIKIAVDFRVIIYFDDNDIITFISVLHRKDAYKALYYLR